MLYFANPVGSDDVAAAMTDKRIGFIDTPRQRNHRHVGVTWIADNGCFGKGFDEKEWFGWLIKNHTDADSCLFATAPDVVGDAVATLERSTPWLSRIRSLGYPAALVAQDGLENLEIPWDDFDALFIGGSTDWKLGAAAAEIVAEAKARGKYVHMGRVNSLKRMLYAQSIGCDSVDGTYLKYGPDVNLARLLKWVDTVKETV